MKAMYNRQTKNVWLEHDDGSVEVLGTAATKLIAYDKIGEVGYMRSTDWRLCVGAIVRKPPPVVGDEQIDATHRLFARPAAMEVPYPWAEPDIPLHGRWTRHEPIDDIKKVEALREFGVVVVKYDGSAATILANTDAAAIFERNDRYMAKRSAARTAGATEREIEAVVAEAFRKTGR